MIPPDPAIDFVVGIGASAGGLEAVAELLGALPPASGLAFLLITHLGPSHESLLAEILGKKSAAPVSVALAGELLRPTHVYVIPADAILTVSDGRIKLKRRSSAGEQPSSVDLLFKSLAAMYAERAVGVVLSGDDSDGSVGICEIRHAGGFTFAQRPESARFPKMPRHAIDTGCVDLVLRPSEIAGELVRLSSRLPRPASTLESGSKSASDAEIEVEERRREELKSAYQQGLSANEEFQSANQGLETSREELQSTNEELTATIEALRIRNQQLTALDAALDRTRVASERARSYGDLIIETERQPLAVLDGTQVPLSLAIPRSRRVIIVDDHKEIGESVARLVRTWGHEVTIARDGPSALTLAETFQPECAIVDLSLPGMNGIEVARRLRKRFPRPRLFLIALTGYAGADIRAGCLAAGFDVHLVKPGEIPLLKDLLGTERPASETTSHEPVRPKTFTDATDQRGE